MVSCFDNFCYSVTYEVCLKSNGTFFFSILSNSNSIPNSHLLHRDSAPAHHALSIWQFVVEKKIVELEKPLYSPDLVTFFRLPKLKRIIKGTRFEGAEAIKSRANGAEEYPRRILQAVHRSIIIKDGKVH